MSGSPLTENEKEQAKIQAAGGKTPSYIAKGMRRSHHTLSKFLRKPEVREQVNIQKAELAGMFDSLTVRIGNSVSDADIEKANLLQKMTSMGIATDKAALLRGDLPSIGIDVTALMDVIGAIRAHDKEESEVRWRLDHARIVAEGSRCIVENCPVHSPRPALPAPQ